MKKSFLLLLSLVFGIGECFSYDVGQSVSKGNYTYTILSDGETPTVSVQVKSGVSLSGPISSSLSSKVTLSSIEYTITEIATNGFKDQTGITLVQIPSNITSIGEGAFNGCTGLTKIYFGTSASDETKSCKVTSVAKDAFKGCTQLDTVSCYGGIGAWLNIEFAGNNYANPAWHCGNLRIDGYSASKIITQVTVPESVTTLSNFALYGLQITSLTLHENVTKIGQYALSGCTALTSIVANRTTPPTAYTNTFNNITPENVTITLPDVNNRKAYKNATGWSIFTNYSPEATFDKEKESTTLTIGANGGHALLSATKSDSIVRVYSNMKYDSIYVVSCPEWVTYTSKNYTNATYGYQKNFVFTAESCATLQERTGDVVIGLKGTNNTFTWALTQQAPTLYPTQAMEGKTTLTIPAEGDTVQVDGVETGKIYLYSSVTLTKDVLDVTASADWVVIDKGWHAADATTPFVRLTLSSKTMSKEDRTATVTVSFKGNPNIKYIYTITQAGAGGLTTNHDGRSFISGPKASENIGLYNGDTREGNSVRTYTSSLAPATAKVQKYNQSDWYSLDISNYSTDKYKLIFANTLSDTDVLRKDSFRVVLPGCDTIKFYIIQEPTARVRQHYATSYTEMEVSNNGGQANFKGYTTKTLTYISNTPLTESDIDITCDSWITPSKTIVADSVKLQFDVEPFTGTEPRTCDMQITIQGNEFTMPLTQNVFNFYYSNSDNVEELVVPQNGGRATWKNSTYYYLNLFCTEDFRGSLIKYTLPDGVTCDTTASTLSTGKKRVLFTFYKSTTTTEAWNETIRIDIDTLDGWHFTFPITQVVSPLDITVNDEGEQTITASNVNESSTIIVNNGGTLTVSEPVTVQTFRIASHAGAGKSGQVINANNMTVTGEVSIDITFDKHAVGNTVAEQWHAFTVPFPVDAVNGVFNATTGAKLTNEVNYAIMVYDGQIRANGKYGWKKYRGILQPGTFYIITVDGTCSVFRFKKTVSGSLTAANNIPLEAYSGTGASTDKGWNGVGNPRLEYGTTTTYDVSVLNPSSYTFELKEKDEGTNFTVGTPFFINVGTAGSLIMTTGAGPAYIPGRRVAEDFEEIKAKVYLSDTNYSDRLSIVVSENAQNIYEAGYDLVKMSMTSTPTVPQIVAKAYNNTLCKVFAPMTNDEAQISLSLYAPQNGEYTLSADKNSGADIYLMEDNMPVWNLSESAYSLDLEKGETEGYSLSIRRAPKQTTGIDINANVTENDIQKIIINNQLYIIRGGLIYNAVGQTIK